MSVKTRANPRSAADAGFALCFHIERASGLLNNCASRARRGRFPREFEGQCCQTCLFQQAARPRAADSTRYRDVKLHSILFGGSDPDQALRVAAGILGERASDGLRLGGRYCQRCEAFPTMHRTWKPQSGVELELGDMVKTN